jgi:serine/threonine-protein kinase haspin
VSFETSLLGALTKFIQHRDLHWGQILVRSIPTADLTPPKVKTSAPSPNRLSSIAMDQPVYGVRATIIDLGLSRMVVRDEAEDERVYWTPFSDEIFMGEGWFVFDLYKPVRVYNSLSMKATTSSRYTGL